MGNKAPWDPVYYFRTPSAPLPRTRPPPPSHILRLLTPSVSVSGIDSDDAWNRSGIHLIAMPLPLTLGVYRHLRDFARFSGFYRYFYSFSAQCLQKSGKKDDEVKNATPKIRTVLTLTCRLCQSSLSSLVLSLSLSLSLTLSSELYVTWRET